MKKFTLLLIFLISFFGSYAQDLDSLLQVAKNNKNDSIKARLLNKVAFSFIFKDTDKALQLIKEGKILSEENDLKYSIVEFTNTHGVYMDVVGISDSAGYYFNKSLKLSREYNFTDQVARSLNNLGMYNWNRGNQDEALKFFFESLKLYEGTNDRKSMSKPLNNIGLIYQEMQIPEKALEYHKKALAIRQEFRMKRDIVASYNNIGICYKNLGNIEEAIDSYSNGLKLAEEANNLIDYYRLLDNLGNAYQLQGRYNEAIQVYLKSLKKPANYETDPKGDLITYSNLVSAHNSKNEPKKALTYAQKSLDLLSENPFHEFYATDLYLHIAESNYMLNRIDEARLFKEKYVALKDSLFSDFNAKALADLEIKYETEKKEKEILVQRAELAEQDLVIQRRNFQVYGLIGLAVLILILGYLIYSQQKLKNNQLKKENDLKDALAKIETQNRLQEQRLRISRDLHDNIGAQLTFIISSLDNLKFGFEMPAKLGKKLEDISEFTSVTIFELRDTIWAMNKSAISFDDLQTRISNFIEKADLSQKDINFSFKVDENQLGNIRFTSIQGINIYRIIQEAINNAIKYSKTSNIEVNILKINDSIQIEILDNGVGFNKNEIEFGNGLNNIEKRALELNGQLTIDSERDKGTSIKVVLEP